MRNDLGTENQPMEHDGLESEPPFQLGCMDQRHGLEPHQKTAVTTGFLKAMLEAQEYRCALTGIKLTPKTAGLDHKRPLSKGGEHSRENVHIIDARVNRMKGALDMDEFIALCRLVADQNGFNG